MTTHNHLTTLASRIGLAVVLGLFSMAPAMADRDYDNWDFRGEYKYSTIEANWLTEYGLPGKIDFCSSFGTAVADGAGTVEYFETNRCNLEGNIDIFENSGVLKYEVLPNGEVLLYDPDSDPYSEDPIVHGVLVDRGDTILIDGTAGSENLKNLLFRQGSLVRQWGDKGATNW